MFPDIIAEALRGTMHVIGVLFWIAVAGIISIIAWIGYGLYCWLS